MFTGLIESLGTITSVSHLGSAVRLTVRCDMEPFSTETGASVSIDGACLTVEEVSEKGEMVFTAVQETLKRTTLSTPNVGRRVNLERAMMLGGRLDGHIVLGHVDGVGRIESDRISGVSLMRTICVPDELVCYMAQKGSVAIDGISLTIAEYNRGKISISLIPHTVKETTMSIRGPGDMVNIECDVLARYLNQLVRSSEESNERSDVSNSGSLLQKMERFGF